MLENVTLSCAENLSMRIGGKRISINTTEVQKELFVIAAFFATLKLKQSGAVCPSIYEMTKRNGMSNNEVDNILSRKKVKRIIAYYMQERICRI